MMLSSRAIIESRADEILILRRLSGYLRLRIPPLVYDPSFTYQLKQSLESRPGVRKVILNRGEARLSVHYQAEQVSERALLLEIDKMATPALRAAQQPLYQKTLSVQRLATRKLPTWVIGLVGGLALYGTRLMRRGRRA